jgi:hypothetical protein
MLTIALRGISKYRGNEAKRKDNDALTLAMITAASAQPSTTFRNEKGRTTGTATRDANGTTTFRDASGRTTGTATAPRR